MCIVSVRGKERRRNVSTSGAEAQEIPGTGLPRRWRGRQGRIQPMRAITTGTFSRRSLQPAWRSLSSPPAMRCEPLAGARWPLGPVEAGQRFRFLS